jgi:hypothetical protein
MNKPIAITTIRNTIGFNLIPETVAKIFKIDADCGVAAENPIKSKEILLGKRARKTFQSKS